MAERHSHQSKRYANRRLDQRQFGRKFGYRSLHNVSLSTLSSKALSKAHIHQEEEEVEEEEEEEEEEEGTNPLLSAASLFLLHLFYGQHTGFQAKSLTGSFDTVYQFLPLLVQGFLGSKAEGALFKCLSESQEEQSNNWNVFLKEGSSFKMIASQASRPDDDELELALYNNVATNNPVIKGIKSAKQNLDENLDKMKGLFSKEG